MEKKQLNEYEIKEFIQYFGVEVFTNDDLFFWVNKENNYEEFMNKYFLNIYNDVTYADNILKIYYVLDDLPKRTFTIELKGNEDSYGSSRISTFRIPLYNTIDNDLIGTLCINDIFHQIKNDPILDKGEGNGLFIQGTLSYLIEKNIFFPKNINNSKLEDDFQAIDVVQSRGSRDGATSFYQPGDVYVLTATTQSENGLDKMNGVVSYYITPDKKRNIILNFDTVKSTNFIPKQNYGRKIL